MIDGLYIGYAVWLIAGCVDFICHRRSDLPHTSGVAESALHLMQLFFIGCAVTIGLAFQLSMGVLATLLVLVLAHAVAGYADSKVAYKRRDVRPFEQHVHSVLDMAPIAGLLIAIWMRESDQWAFQLRDPPLSASHWCAIIGSALLLCVIPAAGEFAQALAVRRRLT